MYKSEYFSCLSPINQAHLLERKAEQCLRKDKYDEAIAFHQDAGRLLQNLLNNITRSPELHPENVLDSLQAQINHHHKQDKLILLRKKQKEILINERNKRALKNSHQEPFQDLINCSTTSIDSYDSNELVSTSSHSFHNNLLQERLAKREEVIRTLGVLVRQQQHQILVLSSKLKEKDNENQRLRQKLDSLIHDRNEDESSEVPQDVL